MKKLLLITLLLITVIGYSQNPETKKQSKPNVTIDATGNYVALSSPKEVSMEKTNKTFTDSKGIVYPVYKSKNDKLFVIKISKKTGKEYRYYLKN